MPVYEYRGLTPEGRVVAGVIDAENPRGARSKLKRMGVYTTAVQGERATGRLVRRRPWLLGLSRNRIHQREVVVLTRQLATLLSAGLPVIDALTAVLEHADRSGLRRVLTEIRESVREGQSLADALEVHASVFVPVYVQMVRAGEAGGNLEAVFVRLAEFLEDQAELRDRVWAALAYPAFLFVTGALVLTVLMVVTIPRITAMFAQMHRVLPFSTRFLIGFSDFLTRQGWWLVILCVLGAVGLARYLATTRGRALKDELVLKTPVIGRLVRMLAISRLARTLGMLLRSGVHLLAALDIAKPVIGNVVLERMIDWTREELTKGKGLAVTLARTGVMPTLLTHMVAVGEKSGDLDGMLLRAARVYDMEAESTVKGMTSLLAPSLVLLMGILVLFIVTAILVPIFDLSGGVR